MSSGDEFCVSSFYRQSLLKQSANLPADSGFNPSILFPSRQYDVMSDFVLPSIPEPRSIALQESSGGESRSLASSASLLDTALTLTHVGAFSSLHVHSRLFGLSGSLVSDIFDDSESLLLAMILSEKITFDDGNSSFEFSNSTKLITVPSPFPLSGSYVFASSVLLPETIFLVTNAVDGSNVMTSFNLFQSARDLISGAFKQSKSIATYIYAESKSISISRSFSNSLPLYGLTDFDQTAAVEGTDASIESYPLDYSDGFGPSSHGQNSLDHHDSPREMASTFLFGSRAGFPGSNEFRGSQKFLASEAHSASDDPGTPLTLQLAVPAVSADVGGQKSSGASLSTGALIGIIIGLIALVVLIGCIVFVALQRKRHGPSYYSEEMDIDPDETIETSTFLGEDLGGVEFENQLEVEGDSAIEFEFASEKESSEAVE
jgi:hypothetical protein